tara:strand:+ start:104 stop:379 length:276 start_codon:yes stop_codon:yes gene_type:complete
MNREQLMEHLKTKCNVNFVSTTEEFNGSVGGVWLSGEDSADMYDGALMFKYYASLTEPYELGVHNIMYEWLDQLGWYAEWNDAGTIMLWEI